MNIENIGTSLFAETKKPELDSPDHDLQVGHGDDQHMHELLETIASSFSSDTPSKSNTDQKLAAYLAKNNCKISNQQGLSLLTACLAGGKLTPEHLDAIAGISSSLQGLPLAQQVGIGDQLLATTHAELTNYLNDKSLSSDQVKSAKQTLQTIQLAQANQATLNSAANNAPSALPVANGINGGNIMVNSLLTSTVNPGYDSQLPIVLGSSNGLTTMSASYWNTGVNNIFGSQSPFNSLDLVSKAIIVLLGYINTTEANALSSLESNYVSMINNIGGVTSLQQMMSEVPQFMAANSSQIPEGGINPLIALDVAMNGVNVAAQDSGLNPSDLQIYSTFVNQCPGFMSALTNAYNQYKSSTSQPESFAQLINGDGNFGGLQLTGQSQIMAFFAQNGNSLGTALIPNSPNPLFSAAWTNSGPNSLYTNPNGVVGSQLMFTANSVSQYIGSGVAASNPSTSVIGQCGQLLTSAASSNNQTQSMMNIISQEVSGIWHLIGGNLIPDAKLVIDM